MRRKILIAVLSLVVALCSFGAVACSGGSSDSGTGTGGGTTVTSELEKQQRKVYDTYVVYAEAQGIIPVTYEEWLYTIKGEAGINGINGIDGVGISEITLNEFNELVITLTDGTVQNLGPIVSSGTHEHVFGEWTDGILPTCTSIGYENRECSDCGYVEYNFIEATGHTFGEAIISVAPSAGIDGYNFYTCEVCGGAKLEVVEGTVYEISGIVYKADTDYDETNDVALEGVYITLCDADGNAVYYTTLADGSFAFSEVYAGQYTINCYLAGYNNMTYDFDTEVDGVEFLSKIFLDVEQQTVVRGTISIADADLDPSNNSPLENATVTLTKETGTSVLELTYNTIYDGSYYFEGLPAGIYKLTVEKEGYISAEQFINVEERQETVQNMTLEIIEFIEDALPGVASGKILDAAVQGEHGVEGLTLQVREGINNVTGEVLLTLTSGSEGAYAIDTLEAGNYTIYIVDERELEEEDLRYSSAYFNIKILAGQTIPNQNGSVSNNAQHADSIQIKLTWGSSPSDLDSHLTGPYGSTRFHLYYGSNSGPNGTDAIDDICALDRDDTNSYGPETTTIDLTKGYEGVYRFSVHNFSNKNSSSSSALANSGAKVEVYIGGVLRYTFYAPNEVGTLWTVFEYDTTTGLLTAINSMSNQSTPSAIG